MARIPRRPPGGSITHWQFRSTVAGLRAATSFGGGGSRTRRRKTLAELLSDPEESERLTRETAWVEAIPPAGNEAG